MKLRTHIATALVIVGCALTAMKVYFSEFYYKKPDYTLSTINCSTAVLRNVVTKLYPKGQDPCGILDPGQEKLYMDPRWPVPEKITVSFDVEGGAHQEVDIITGLSKTFRGKLTVMIVKTNDAFVASLEKDARQ